MITFLAGVSLAVAAATQGGPVEHRVRVEHPTGAVDASYRGDVAIMRKQVGSPAPGGRPSSLSCVWRADVTVSRKARHASGSLFTRSVERKGVVEGRRPGWCLTHRDSISREVASRDRELRGDLVTFAQEDRPALLAEIDRLRETPRAG